MAHQLKSRFHITNLSDIVSLARLYGDGAQGSLVFTFNVKRKKEKKKKKSPKYEQKSITVPWTSDPFGELYRLMTTTAGDKEEEEYDDVRRASNDRHVVNGYIVSQLWGASTLLGVAQQPTRLDKASYGNNNNNDADGINKTDLVAWADYIDRCMHAEMNRENDIGYLWKRPVSPMPSMQALFTALRLSQYGTHCLPCRSGFVVTNPEVVVYPIYIGIDGTGESVEEDAEKVVYQALVFDKDDGFLDVATGGRALHLNKAVEAWHRDCCARPLQSYMDQYGPEEAYVKIHKNELTEFTGGKRKRDDNDSDDNDDNPVPHKKDKKDKKSDKDRHLEDLILRHIAISMCSLDQQSMPLSSVIIDGGENHFLKQFSDCGVDGAQLTVQTCWDYVCVGQEGGKGPYRRLAELIDDKLTDIDSTGVGLTLRRLTYQWIEAYPYQLVVDASTTIVSDSTRYRMEPCKEHGKRMYKAVDYRVSPMTGMAVVAISVAFLKQRLGVLLPTVVAAAAAAASLDIDIADSTEEEVVEESSTGSDRNDDCHHHEVHVMDGWDDNDETELIDNDDGERLE